MMELPQPRPLGTEGSKPTQDFLSLYSPAQEDPKPSQGGYLETHDFLLEQVGINRAKEEKIVKRTTLEKPLPSVEHLLPGGIGTYSISHVSYFNQRVLKQEGATSTVAQESTIDRNEENSNCSSYTGSGFSLWEESVAKKGKTRKENIAEDSHAIRDVGVKIGGKWTPSEPPSQSFSSNHHNNTTFSSLSSSQPSWQRNQSFIDIIKSAKNAHDDEDEYDEEFVPKKDPSSLYRGKMDGKGTDQRANTPRSKHSATEQRRRSKINDRFQTLREIIPNSDQRRDKASFLLGVIEYIQFLQKRVHTYEGSYQEWNHDPAKLKAWRNSQRPSEIYVDKSRETALMFDVKVDENNVTLSPTIPRNQQNPVESDMSTGTTFQAMANHSGLTTKEVPLPMSMSPNIFTLGGTSCAENTSSQRQSQSLQSRACTADCAVVSEKLKEQELTIENGTISISSVYSQGLLNTLTQALHSSGVDLSQASISVQIDLAKQANCSPRAPSSIAKEEDGSDVDESDQALKRLKTSKN